jgi:cell division septum initiation protein DivIVA
MKHRRKQNRAAQRTFRQRKELERQELQARLDAAVTSTATLQTECEELKEEIEKMKEKVKELEEENLALKQKEGKEDTEDSYFPKFPSPAEKDGRKDTEVKV